MEIQTDVFSQLGSRIVNFIIQSVIRMTITNICSKNTTSDRGSVTSLQNFNEDLYCFLFLNQRVCQSGHFCCLYRKRK